MLATSLQAGVKDMPANYFILVVKSSIVCFLCGITEASRILKRPPIPKDLFYQHDFKSYSFFLITSLLIKSSRPQTIHPSWTGCCAVWSQRWYLRARSPQGGSPAAWACAWGTRRPRGFQPPCCLARNQRVRRTRRGRSHPSPCHLWPESVEGGSLEKLCIKDVEIKC